MAERESPYLWSTTALDNGAADPNINFAENQLPSTVNNSARAAMAAHARLLKDTNGTVTTGGSANAYTATVNETWTALANGLKLVLKASFSNTGAATLNVTNADGAALGAKAIRKYGANADAALSASDIRSGGYYYFIYATDGNSSAGAWILLNPTFSGAVDSFAGNHGDFTVSRGITNSTNDIRLASYQLRAYRSTSQSVTSGVKTKIQFDTESWDPQNWFDNATNYRFTPLVAGKIVVTVGVSATAASGATLVLAMIYKNGTEEFETLNVSQATGGCAIITGQIDVNGTTDYVEGWGRINGSTTSFDGGSTPIFTWMHVSYTGP